MNPTPHFDAEKFRAEPRYRILIADDERLIADTLKLILTQEGFEAIAVYGGEPAVQLAREWQPDLFLSDVFMPDMNGIEAAIRISALRPACKVILISGKAIVEDLLRDPWKLGYDFELLYKPVHPTELLEIVRWTLSASASSKTPIHR